MLKNLSIKMKLILSFLIVSILVALLAAYNLIGLNKSSDGFSNYRGLAKDSLLVSTVQANMLMMRINVLDYLNNQNNQNITEFNKYHKISTDTLKTALEEITDSKRVTKVKEIEDFLNKYKATFQDIISLINKRNEIVENNLNINGKEIEKKLSSIIVNEKNIADKDLAISTSQSIRFLLLTRLYVVKFLDTNLKNDINKAIEEFSKFENDISSLKNLSKNAQIKNAIDEVSTLSS
jgi:methyl-accepting chemotaxis protein